MAINNEEPAFPFEHGHSPDAANVRECGMSLRDWMAGQALAGILANPETLKTRPPLTHAERADAAYQAADAMLAERERLSK